MCFSSKDELRKGSVRLRRRKEDHKKIGKEMELYMIDEMIGKGLPVWLPNGEILKSEIERFAIETEELWVSTRDYSCLAKRQLFEASGHLPLCRWYVPPHGNG